MVSSRAERGVRRTMGCESERIGVTRGQQADGLQLREAFDIGAGQRETANPLDESDE